MPIRNERRKARPRACGSGVKPSSRMIVVILRRVSSLTKGESLITRDTVFFETLAMRAMSLIVDLLRLRSELEAAAGACDAPCVTGFFAGFTLCPGMGPAPN